MSDSRKNPLRTKQLLLVLAVLGTFLVWFFGTQHIYRHKAIPLYTNPVCAEIACVPSAKYERTTDMLEAHRSIWVWASAIFASANIMAYCYLFLRPDSAAK